MDFRKDERSAAFLQSCILGKLNIIVSGGTGTGKTTLLNVLSSYIPNGERIVTDGPFAETKEILGGVFLTDLPDLDEAIRLASLIPSVRHGAIEIRPVLQ